MIVDKSDKVSHNKMEQIASVLLVATIFLISLRTLISRQRRGLNSLIRETIVPMQELEPKVLGGLYARKGHNWGFYGIPS